MFATQWRVIVADKIGTLRVAQLFGIDREPPLIHQRRRRLIVGGAASLIAILIGGVALAVWRTSSDGLEKPVEQSVSLEKFQAFQQQVLLRTQENSELLQAQRGEVKRLADQISELEAKIGELQRLIAPQPIGSSTINPTARKKSGKLKPQRRITTGRAALPPPVKLVR